VVRNVLGEGVILVAVALVIGAVAALVLGRSLGTLRLGISPIHPISLLLAAVALGAVALLTPAIRATRIQLTEALRE
jgi:ABC-type antimicrobial peptide transport system permease subunit